MIADFFIGRPKFAFVIAIVIVIMGLIAMTNLPVAQYPEITPPQVAITVNYPGANATTVMKTVVEPIETQVNGVKDMIYMSSQASNNGMATITVSFKIGSDPDIATVNVQNRVAEALPQLPEVVKSEGVTVKQVSSDILMFVTVYSPSQTYDGLYLSNYATINMVNDILLINGVGSASVVGSLDYAMRIWLNPNKLATLKLTASDVISAIKNQNIQVASGQIGSAPISGDQQFEYVVQTQGRLTSVEEFENILIRELSDGSNIRVKDVAKVQLGAETYSAYGKLRGKPCANLAIYQRPGANALNVAGEVRATINKLSKKFPKDLNVEILYDTTTFVKASIMQVITTLFIAFILVVLVVFIFLQDFRSTLIPLIAIPVSLIGTFAFLLAVGFSINIITLLALVLAIGLVVDDAIVVVENVNRIMTEEELTPGEAAKKSMKQVTSPIIATTLVLMAVFVPVVFIPGITGQLYRQFAVTVIIAVIISAFNALTLTPALCATMLQVREKKKKFIFFVWFNKLFSFITGRYNWIVSFFVKKLAIVIILFLLLLGGIYAVYTNLPTGFLPNEDQGIFMVNVQLPSGGALPRTGKVVQEISDYISQMEGVEYVMSFTGYSILTSSTASNSGLVIAGLTPWDKRKSPELSQSAILDKANMKFATISSAKVEGFGLPPISGLGASQGFKFELQGESGISPQKLSSILNYFLSKANQQPELAYAYSTYQADVPQIYVNVNRAKAEKLKVPLTEIYNTLQTLLGSMYVNEFNKFGKVYQVIVQAQEEFRRNINDIKKLYVRNIDGGMVPLSTLVTIKSVLGPGEVSHYNTKTSVAVNGQAAKGYSSGQAINAMERVANNILPKDMSYSWTGTAYQEILAGNTVVIIFIVSIIFLYLFIVALYESWMLVFSVIFSIPFAFFGALFATWITGLNNNIYAQIGFILMFGLASKTAILIIEFAKEQRKTGKSITESATYAANIRFRPIIMTSIAFIMGVLPLVIATGAGAANCRSIGTSVFGGMIFTAILGTIFVPAFYVLFQKLIEKKSK